MNQKSNMSYTKKSFDQCTFNPLIEGKLLTEYPKLCEILAPEWEDTAPLDSLLRYMIIVYDPKSPLFRDERDLNYRKSQAAELAGFDMEDEQLLIAVYESHYPLFADLIVRYLTRFGRSREWAAICAFEFAFWESIRKLMEPISGKTSKEELESVQKKSAIKEEIDKDIKRLDELYRKFLGEDEDLEKKVKQRLRPELVADRK